MDTTKAQKQNPALEPFKMLAGDWRIEGTHPYFPGATFHGRTSFDWLEGGAFLIMRQRLDDPRFPEGIAIFGSDDGAQRYLMLYFDERGVSRHYNVSLVGRQLTWWRDDSRFSQRMVLTMSDDMKTIIGNGEMRRDGGAWEPDLALSYTRIG